MSSASRFISKVYSFVRRRGIPATLARIGLELQRIAKGRRMILFYCNFCKITGTSPTQGPYGQIEIKNTISQLDADEKVQIMNSGNPDLIQGLIEDRFGNGASLWLFKINNKIAGFGWTMVGGTMEPHYFPLTPDDVHLFDFYVFPEHRGKRINPVLVCSIIEQMAQAGRGRAFIECAEWNNQQIASLKRTPFQRLGVGIKSNGFGKTKVKWYPGFD